ncbi:FAD:protein FMN transferase [Pararhodobacter aggregans]
MPFHPTRRQMIAASGAFASTLLLPGLGRAQNLVEVMEGRAFASHWRVSAPAGQGIEAHRPAIDALLAGIDAQMSPWRADSEVTRFNEGTGAESPVSAETAHVARAALDLAAASGGWFDPSVGPLVARWGFGPIRGNEAGDWRGLSVGHASLGRDWPGLTMDLCGIAKGRALDLVRTLLQDAGVADALVDLGGELGSLGRHPAGRDWRVAVEDPRPGNPGAAMGLRLPAGMAVATSGTRAQSYAMGGHRYGHIIAPREGRPSEGRFASVSVLADSAMRADGWATALIAAGEAGPDLARAQGLPALFLAVEGDALRPVMTGDVDRYLL